MSRSPFTTVLSLAIPLTGCDRVRYVEAFEPEGPLERVELHVERGTVDIVPADHLRVERAVRAPEGTIHLAHQLEDGVLTLDARCTSLIPCAVDTELGLPENVDVSLVLEEGDVWATGARRLVLELGEGNADLEATGDISVNVGSGSIRANVSENTSARLAVGDGDIEVSTSPGHWRLDAHAARLDVRGIDPDDHAVGLLELVAPAGTVTVRGQGPVAQR